MNKTGGPDKRNLRRKIKRMRPMLQWPGKPKKKKNATKEERKRSKKS